MPWSGGSGGSGTWNQPSTTTSGASSVTWTSDLPTMIDMSCLVCEDALVDENGIMANNSGLGLCALCREAILLFRRKVLEQMARDLLAMGDDCST